MAGATGFKGAVGGGAKAAAADLARARKQGEGRDNAKYHAVQELLRLVDKYMRGLRTYEHDHPTLVGFLDELDEKIQPYLREHESLPLDVHATRLSLDEEVVYETERVEQNVWFPLFGDKIRQLTIANGVQRAELRGLFDILNDLALHKLKQGEERDGEDDAVTLMWQRDFEHISHIAVDSFAEGAGAVDGGGEDRETAIARVRDVVNLSTMKDLSGSDLVGQTFAEGEVAHRMTRVVLSAADVTFLQAENLAALQEMPTGLEPAARGATRALDDDQRSALLEELANERNMIERYVECVLAAMGYSEDPADVQHLIARMKDYFDAVALEGEHAKAVRVLQRLDAIAATWRADPTNAARIDALHRALSSQEVVTSIVDTVVRAYESAQEVPDAWALMAAMPGPAAAHFVGSSALVSDRDLRRRMYDVIGARGEATLDAAIEAMVGAGRARALDLLYLVRSVGGERAVTALEEATKHAQPRVRAEAMYHFFLAADPAAARDMAFRGLRDESPLVRRGALRWIAQAKPNGAQVEIKRRIDNPDFDGHDLAEKKRLYLAYAQVGGDGTAAWFVERLEQRNLLGKAAVDHQRACAAWALGQLRHTDARTLLQKLASSRLIRGMVKEAAGEALAMLDKPREPDTPFVEPPRDLTPTPVPSTTPASPETIPAMPMPAPSSATRPIAPTPPPTVQLPKVPSFPAPATEQAPAAKQAPAAEQEPPSPGPVLDDFSDDLSGLLKAIDAPSRLHEAAPAPLPTEDDAMPPSLRKTVASGRPAPEEPKATEDDDVEALLRDYLGGGD